MFGEGKGREGRREERGEGRCQIVLEARRRKEDARGGAATNTAEVHTQNQNTARKWPRSAGWRSRW